ncbi:MAG: hypothetical protein KGZ63_12885 [Clostridiales bacterium]|jgi:hypothetical protein|nr:hypothetical protein [Clostridiales bacterium]
MEIYQGLTLEDWLYLCAIFIAANSVLTGWVSIFGYMIVKWYTNGWSSLVYKKTVIAYSTTTYLFAFSLSYVFGIFHSKEGAPVLEFVFFVFILAAFGSFLLTLIVKKFVWLNEIQMQNPKFQQAQQKKYTKSKERIRKQKIEQNIPFNEEDLASEVRKMSERRLILITKICCSIIAVPSLILFSPPVFYYILNLLL